MCRSGLSGYASSRVCECRKSGSAAVLLRFRLCARVCACAIWIWMWTFDDVLTDEKCKRNITHACMRTHMCASMRARRHAHEHTHAHMQTHTHTCLLADLSLEITRMAKGDELRRLGQRDGPAGVIVSLLGKGEGLRQRQGDASSCRWVVCIA